MTLDSGVDVKTQIMVKPKQSNPKLVQSTKNIVLFEFAKGTAYGDEITISVADKQVGKIKNIELASASDTFEDAASNAKPVYISVKVTYCK